MSEKDLENIKKDLKSLENLVMESFGLIGRLERKLDNHLKEKS